MNHVRRLPALARLFFLSICLLALGGCPTGVPDSNGNDDAGADSTDGSVVDDDGNDESTNNDDGTDDEENDDTNSDNGGANDNGGNTGDGDDPPDADGTDSNDDNGGDGTDDSEDDTDNPPDPPSATRYFPDAAIWYQDISQAPLDDESDAVIEWLNDHGGFGLGRMQIDFSIEVLQADADTPLREFEATDDWFDVECDSEPVPVPVGGALEGEEGYACESDGDCHLIVVDRDNSRLYEMWRANIVDGEFYGGCLAIWDMSRVYGPEGRGEDCTSADAAGFPIAPLLFTADEVAAGSVDHAIRFILPNARIRNRVYVSPATHSTSATGGGSSAPPYGARFRLRADFPLDGLPNEGARVVARGMQKYGLFLADAGNVALTAQSDRFTTAKWDGLLGSRDLDTIQITDLEMVESGERIEYTGDCVREP